MPRLVTRSCLATFPAHDDAKQWVRLEAWGVPRHTAAFKSHADGSSCWCAHASAPADLRESCGSYEAAGSALMVC